MAEIEDDGPTPPSPPTNGAVALFLALYLLLLAFFILLNTISTFEEVKTREVQESLSSAFAAILPPTTSLQTVTSIEGPTVSAQETQDKLGHLFETAIKVVRVEVIQPGKLMEVIMHVDQLFDTNSILVRERQADFMRQLAEVLADDDGYASYEMEMVMGSQIEDKGTIQIENNLQIAQAGSFARELALDVAIFLLHARFELCQFLAQCGKQRGNVLALVRGHGAGLLAQIGNAAFKGSQFDHLAVFKVSLSRADQ